MPQTEMYLIRIAQPLTEVETAWFDGLTIIDMTSTETALMTPAIDQTGLHGILATLRDLAIPLVAVVQVSASLPLNATTGDR